MSGQRPWIKRVVYHTARYWARLAVVLGFRLRCFGRHYLPATGPVLVCANHQSFWDPVLVGLCFQRRLNYLARESLFHVQPLGAVIQFMDGIPIDREGMGLAGLRESIRRIRRGEMVLIFPEGTRSANGELQPFQPGLCALARRGGTALLPVAIEGAFASWPRAARWPRRTTIHVSIGPPITPQEIESLDDRSLIAELERRVREQFERSRERLRHLRGGLPPRSTAGGG